MITTSRGEMAMGDWMFGMLQGQKCVENGFPRLLPCNTHCDLDNSPCKILFWNNKGFCWTALAFREVWLIVVSLCIKWENRRGTAVKRVYEEKMLGFDSLWERLEKHTVMLCVASEGVIRKFYGLVVRHFFSSLRILFLATRRVSCFEVKSHSFHSTPMSPIVLGPLMGQDRALAVAFHSDSTNSMEGSWGSLRIYGNYWQLPGNRIRLWLGIENTQSTVCQSMSKY